MRRLFSFLTVLASILFLALSVSAQPEITNMNFQAGIISDGTSQLNMSVTVHLDQPAEHLEFPVPLDATSITLNGSRARIHTYEQGKAVDLSKILKGMAGDISFTLSYSLPNLVEKNEAQLLELKLPMLSGFAYPTRNLSFTITLPGEISAKPGFSSGYHQFNIEQDLSVTTSGATVSGQSIKELKDHETLMMILPVTEQMFPQTVIVTPDIFWGCLVVGILAFLALLYWFLTLRRRPQWAAPCSQPPEGITAGQIRSILHLEGADLTAMVFSWAQLGYIVIQPDRRGRILLHRQMDMGNERSGYERRIFHNLFAGRTTLDAAGSHYAAQWQKVHKTAPYVQDFVHHRSGNRTVFRILYALACLVSGAMLGFSLGAGAIMQWPLAVLLGAAGFAAAWMCANWASALFQPNHSSCWMALAATLLWILMGLAAGQLSMGVAGALIALLGGLLYSFAGRRTEAGKQAIREIVGLRRYLSSVSRHELERKLEENPEYFFDLVPFALAMGADKAFAKRFGSLRLPPCPYLALAQEKDKTASQWDQEIQAIQAAMNAKIAATSVQKVIRNLRSLVK